jgi:hypothetical protein
MICTQSNEDKEMNAELKNFLTRIYAGPEVLDRLATTGAKTLEEAWARADARDLVWAVTRPGVMSPEQRRQFLVFVLESIEDKLTDPRSKNILDKLRTNSPITDNDKKAAWAAWVAAREAALAAAARADAAADAAEAAVDATAAADATTRENQARWIRENIKLSDLHIN